MARAAHPTILPAMAVRTLFPILAVLAVLASSASAGQARPPDSRLVTCGDDACLLVRGVRDAPGDAVTVAGHPVATSGGRAWRARLAMADLRAWAAPGARSVAVAVAGRTVPVELPVGLLGRHVELAALVVRAR